MISTDRLRIYAARLVVLAVILVTWEFVPTLLKSANIVALNPLFISTPAGLGPTSTRSALSTG